MFGDDDFRGTQQLVAERVALLGDLDDGVFGDLIVGPGSDRLGDARIERLAPAPRWPSRLRSL